MLIIGAILDTHRSLKDKTLKITFETNEPTPEQLLEIVKHNQTFGFLAFKEDKFKQSEKEHLKNLESDYQETGKSKSQRLRAVMYKNFEQNKQGYEIFDDYYNYQMEKLINHFKEKLN